jgi:teichuronic acid biosynthesis glycosyltransferase TuaC
MRVLFVCSGTSQQSISPVVAAQGRSLEKEGVSVDYFPVGGRGVVSYLRAVTRLRKQLSEKTYDCLHAHYGLCGIISLLAKSKHRLVVSFMGDDILGSRNYRGRVSLASRLMARVNACLSARCYNHTIVKSEGMIHPAMNRNSVSVIPNGVDTELFRPLIRSEALVVTGWEPETRHIVFVSDPSRREKNFQLARRAVEHLGRKDIELHAIHGLDHSQMPFVYNSADGLLLTSFHEGSANAVKEAMACSCPVISTETGDAPWVTGNTFGCYIVPLDLSAVTGSVEGAIEFRISKGFTDGRARIISLGLDSASTADRIISVYQKITG